MKLSRIIIIGGIVLVFLAAVLALVSSKVENKYFFESIIINNKIERSEEFNSINKIQVKVDIGQINLLPSESDKVSYQYFGLFSNTFSSEVSSNKLMLNSSTINLLTFTNISGTQLNIYIPKNKKMDVVIDNNGANVAVRGIKINNLKIKSDIGSSIVQNSIINNKLIASNRIGSIYIKNVKEPNYINIRNIVGSIDLKNMYGKNVYLGNDVGTLTFVNSNKNYFFKNLEVDVSVGKQKIKVK